MSAPVEGALVLSPMVDVTDPAFRSVAKEWGADVTCSEMVSAAGLVHQNAKSWRLVEPWPGERPFGVQIMGGEPAVVAAATRAVAERLQGRIEFLDLNLGCPSPNILRSKAGGFLLRDPGRAGAVIAAAVDAAQEGGIPHVSAKMRLGMDERHLTYLEVGRAAVDAGASWVTLHGRTVAQGYAGTADWGAIATLVEAVDIPVVGNGDLRAPADVLRMRDETGCAGFFIARAAMHDPTVFARMRDALDGRAPDEPPDLETRRAVLATYLERASDTEDLSVLRRQATRFVAGVPGAKALRKAIHAAQDAASIRALLA